MPGCYPQLNTPTKISLDINISIISVSSVPTAFLNQILNNFIQDIHYQHQQQQEDKTQQKRKQQQTNTVKESSNQKQV